MHEAPPLQSNTILETRFTSHIVDLFHNNKIYVNELDEDTNSVRLMFYNKAKDYIDFHILGTH